MNKLIIQIDGGSRGNPGPSALGVVFSQNGQTLKEYSQYLGRATNNEAEYQALIFALKKAKALFGKAKVKQIAVEARSDSELLVKQLTACYKVENPAIQQLFLKAWNLKIDFPNLRFVLVPRSENKQADALVNQALDSQSKKQSLF